MGELVGCDSVVVASLPFIVASLKACAVGGDCGERVGGKSCGQGEGFTLCNAESVALCLLRKCCHLCIGHGCTVRKVKTL